MLGDLLGSILNFGKTDKGLFTLLAALTSAADRDRGTRPTGGGVTYGMSAPRRLQQVGGLGRYQDVVRFDEGGPTISVNEPSPLLWGLTQGPYGPLLAYDIGPKMERPSMAPGAPRKTDVTQGYLSGQEGPGMGMGPQEEAALNAAIASGAHGKSMAELNQTLTNLAGKSSLGVVQKGLANLLAPLTAQLTGTSEQAIGLANALGVTPQQAQSMITTMGLEGVPVTGAGMPDPSLTGGSSLGIDALGPEGTGGNSSVSSAVSGEGAGAPPAGAAAGMGAGWADGGSVFSMQDGGFVMTKDAVEGAGGPQGIAQILPQARMIGGPPDPTGKRDLTPAKITGPNGVTPARVSRGEAYVPPEGVRQAGGARQLYNLMNKLQRRA